MISDSDDERYEQELVKQRQEAEARLQEEEEQQHAERRAKKEAGSRKESEKISRCKALKSGNKLVLFFVVSNEESP